MRILLSTIGSRGDVQPLLALALALRNLGHAVRFCTAPNFTRWLAEYGFPTHAVGPDLEQMAAMPPPQLAAPRPRPSAEFLQQLANDAVRRQFTELQVAAQDCDLLIAANVVQYATHSIAELLGVPYRFVAYSPDNFPSGAHPPPKMLDPHPHDMPAATNLQWWQEESVHWNQLFGATINEERGKLGLAPIADVKHYLFGERPLLAADPVLAPLPETTVKAVQHGAWLIDDTRPLPEAVERFLAAGPAPVYIGFGSMRTDPALAQTMIAAAKALGRRVVLSSGWARLTTAEDADTLVLGDCNHSALFPRVAAIVHHGGAGTTTAAALAGTPQLLVPHNYDQFWWARRIQQLGVGASVARDGLDTTLAQIALHSVLTASMAMQAKALASRMVTNGAVLAAQQCTGEDRQ